MITRTIEFDGGTSCNIPRLGYGIGYGSYQIEDMPVKRISHNKPMSANVAEIMTAKVALDDCLDIFGPSHILIRGDSQIALKWILRRSRAQKKKHSEDFKDATQAVGESAIKHLSVKTEWRGRLKSVELFGH